MKQIITLILGFLFLGLLETNANNVTISNVTLNGKNIAQAYQLVNFDITWENSWNINGGPRNWDAAWVFVKYRLKTDNIWHHTTLNYADGTGTADGHTEPANSNISSSNDTGSGGAHGVFIHRTDIGQGTVNFAGVKLRWNYGIDDLGDGDNVEISVMAIEMVYVRQGAFYVGSGGTEDGAFYTYPSTTNPYHVTSESAITVGTATGNLYYAEGFGDQASIPASFPKGYSAFYCMKYEITQAQYVGFLNKLTYTQQITRTAQPPNLPSGTAAMTIFGLYRNGIEIKTSGSPISTPAIYGCDLNGNNVYDEANDGQSIACNHLSWGDVAAYLDWSALRPMTELEYEKAGRGNQIPKANEYAWGNTTVTGAIAITNSGANTEIAQAGANCTYNWAAGIQGPMRSGNFAQASSSRSSSGASYYGIMELSGNLYERPITVGNPFGRSFLSLNGGGVLSMQGNTNMTTWTGTTAEAVGVRGGSWINSANSLCLSDRYIAAVVSNSRDDRFGGRGCRLAP
jgi:formylglycine-generating enzyme required for sulfatase activity